ncbi:MAG: response regulator transcription factor [Thermodesulfobacteriota bacterium]|nr:response regulator transcription factor [Thermodesulfobacteriota bacterium]
MEKKHILIVEDDEDIQQLVSFNLLKAGFHVTCADDGEEGLLQLGKQPCDCLVLDLMLPGMSGYEVCRTIRENKKYRKLPIIMLTAKGEENDIVAGLEAGGDDYITKPFSPKVLVARINSVLRRGKKDETALDQKVSEDTILCYGELCIDPGRHEIMLEDEKIKLTMTEFNILCLLARRPGWVFSRQQIIDSVRGHDYSVTPRAIDVQVFGLRKKLGKAGELIETVRGIGYRFKN